MLNVTCIVIMLSVIETKWKIVVINKAFRIKVGHQGRVKSLDKRLNCFKVFANNHMVITFDTITNDIFNTFKGQ